MSHTFALVILLFGFVFHNTFGSITFKDGKFYNDDEALFVKGVGYAPVPIGADPTIAPPYGDYFTKNFANIYKRDLAILRELGVNVLRLWGWGIANDHSDFLNMAFNDGIDPIYVAAEFWIGPSSYPNLADPTVQQQLASDFQVFLKTANSHPAILFYILGSDLNAGWNYAGELDALFSVLNMLATAAHGANSTFFVTTALNDVNSMNTIEAYDTNTELDFWSLNVYRGCTFAPLFTEYRTVSSKSLFVSEYGIDSYNDVASHEDDTMQANCIVALSKELLANTQTVLGGAVVEYVDEYWKGKLAIADARHPACPNYNANAHSNCGSPNPGFPDGYVNQEWFGIVNASFTPRTVFNSLQTLWGS